MGSMHLATLEETGLDFVLDFSLDVVVTNTIANNLDGCELVEQLVHGHVDFAVKLATQIGGIQVAQMSPMLSLHGGIQHQSGGVCESPP